MKHQTGFATIAILAILCIVGIAGTGVYIWWQHNAQPPTQASNPNKNSEKNAIPSPLSSDISTKSSLNSYTEVIIRGASPADGRYTFSVLQEPNTRNFAITINDGQVQRPITMWAGQIADTSAFYYYGKSNWSEHEQCVYVELAGGDASDILAFHSNGTKFTNGKTYLRATELGYNGEPLKTGVGWKDDTHLVMPVGGMIVQRYPTYILDTTQATLSKE